jgi:MFS family permease
MQQIQKSDGATVSIGTIALASAIGTTIEWYDFFLYGVMTPLVLNKLFFPNADVLISTLLAYGTFFVGFLSRPIGGIIFGHYGDRIGRKTVLILTVLIMGIATFLIGLLPTYASAGIWAPIMLLGAAHLPGHRHRRRMGRRRADGGRTFSRGQARLLRSLAADRRSSGTAPQRGRRQRAVVPQ